MTCVDDVHQEKGACARYKKKLFAEIKLPMDSKCFRVISNALPDLGPFSTKGIHSKSQNGIENRAELGVFDHMLGLYMYMYIYICVYIHV